MFAIIYLLGTFIADLLKSRRRLEVENLFLRHQVNIILRRPPQRLRLRGSDRALMVWMTRLWPSLLALARVVQPATILRWHRAGVRTYWRWKSQGRPGRPTIEHELRDFIRRMSKENPLWGAPRIHGELLKLGFEVAESTVSKYMIGRRGPPSQSWRTFLRNHADAIAAIDLCVVPTLTFERLFAFLVVGHGRRQLLWFAVTRNPSASGICGECWLHIRLITTSRGRTWRWRRMRRYSELSRGAERSSPRQFFPDCTIAMRGYDFREGQVFDNIRKFVSFRRTYIYRRCDFNQTYALKRRRV